LVVGFFVSLRRLALQVEMKLLARMAPQRLLQSCQ
jgi:hypothetical protein